LIINWFIPEKGLSFSKLRQMCGLSPYNYNRHLASVWIRCLQLIPYFKSHGIDSLINDKRSKADIAIFLRRYDRVDFQLLKEQKNKGAKIIIDLCVNFFDVTGSFVGGYGSTEKEKCKIEKIIKEADVITCSSDYIRNKASNNHSWAVYIPDSIDLEHFKMKKVKQNFEKSKIYAIWAGQSVKISEVEELNKILKSRNISLIIISNEKPDLKYSFEYIPWSYYTFPSNILKGDLCISPRRIDNTYDLGHSHFKIGVFMAQGVPALAAPLPSYQEVIEKTGGGRICESDSEWKKALDEVLDNRQMLWEWSQAAYEGMRCYSTENIAKKNIEVFEKLISGEKVPF